MLDSWDFILLILAGAIGGFFSGMLGVGGGVIFVPVIDHLLQRAGIGGELLVSLILANSLATIAFTGTMSSIKQFRVGNFYPRPIMFTSLPGVVTSLALSWIISVTNIYSKEKFDLFFMSILIFLLIRMFHGRNDEVKEDRPPADVKPFTYGVTGFITGMVTALSGLGGGIVMIPVFTNYLKLNIKVATSVSTGVITVLVFPLIIYYLLSPAVMPVELPGRYGHILLPLVLPLAAGSFFMAPFGVKTAQRMKTAHIKIVFACFVFLVLIRMAWQVFSR